MEYIKLENIAKTYGSGEGKATALQGISLSIQTGEFVAIMGESGSGKSTLLSVLGVLNTPSGGSYQVNGVEVYSLKGEQQADFRRETLGFVFQSFHLIPYLSVVENVMLPLTTKRLKEKVKREMADQALARVGLASKGHRLPNQISGGEQERVAIARAVVNRPPILLADEPTGNLDTRTGREIMRLLQELNGEGMTIIMVTHSTEWARYTHRILHISDGLLEGEETNYAPLELAAAEFSKPEFSAGRPAVSGRLLAVL
jgi:putative ABC transport system ATP-binding protein